MRKPKSTLQFVAEARLVHGDRYDYSLTQYTHSRDLVQIGCPQHGPFKQLPGNHLSGAGCSQCAGVAPLTLDSWAAAARRRHGHRYDYSKVQLAGANAKVEILCPEHGPFWQTPNHHARGCGCPQCARKAPEKTQDLRHEHFLKQAEAVHGDRYDYSKTVYKNNRVKVEIICRQHGSFWQAPANHVHKQLRSGCPKCAIEARQVVRVFPKTEPPGVQLTEQVEELFQVTTRTWPSRSGGRNGCTRVRALRQTYDATGK